MELKDYVEVLRRFNKARKIGEDAEKVLKEMNPGAQLTMAAVALREWLALDSSKELDHEVVKTGVVKSGSVCQGPSLSIGSQSAPGAL